VSHSTNRRNFIKSTAVGGAGLYVSGSPLFAQSKSANEKLNVAVIGVAGRGSANLSGVSGENIVALCDVDELRLAKAATRHGKAKKFNDYRKMLDEYAGQIDAVVVSTPDHNHAPASVMAMKLGKHVYCEKPLAHEVFEARVMTQVAAETKVATQMGNQNHSGAGYRRTVELVQSGAIGEVRNVHTWSNRPVWPQGIGRPEDTPPVPKNIDWDVWLGPAPERPYHSAYMPFKWRGWWDFGTGALGDMGCHIFDPAYWALKLTAPTTVEAQQEGKTSETASKWSIIRYEFPARDTLPAVTFTWWDGGKRPPTDLFEGATVPSNGVLFLGSKGKLLCPHGGTPQLLPKEKFADFKQPESFLPPTMGHHADWINACKNGGQPSSNFAYAGPLTETVLLGNLAIRAGKKIEWDSKNLKVTNSKEATDLVQRAYRKGWTL
jgi:predicted dehydrogenase